MVPKRFQAFLRTAQNSIQAQKDSIKSLKQYGQQPWSRSCCRESIAENRIGTVGEEQTPTTNNHN